MWGTIEVDLEGTKKNLPNQPGEEGVQEEGEQGIACKSEHFGSGCLGWREPPFRPAHTMFFLLASKYFDAQGYSDERDQVAG